MSIASQESAEDARARITSEVGDFSWIKPLGTKVLVAIFRRPEMTKGGIIRPEKNLDEDRYQGKVGLVLAMGPQAFVSDDKTKFDGDGGFGRVAIGDWVMFKTAETWPLAINDEKTGHCRMIDDVDIRAVIVQPDKVW